MFRRLFAISRWVHLYLGLLVLLYLIVVGVTGVLLNHPSLLSGFSVPRWMAPPSYRIDDWNRGSLRTVVFSQQDPSLGFVAGTEGVWKTTDGGVTFQPMTTGYPASRAYRRTNHLLLLEHEDTARLLAATRDGMYECLLEDEAWQRVALGQGIEDVRKILRVEDRLVVFTDSHAYQSRLSQDARAIEFRPVHLEKSGDNPEEGIPLVRLMFALHGGEIWGLAGRLLIDAVGVGLVFLSASAVYMWYFPRVRRWFRRSPEKPRRAESTKRRIYRWLYKYHVDIGVWTTVFLVVIAATALFMPPSPLVFLTLGKEVPRAWWPGPLPENPLHESIGNAAYDPVGRAILIESRSALWRGPADFSEPFRRDEARIPVGAMGTNVMDVEGDGSLLIGSFSGLYRCRPDGGPVIDLSTGEPHVPRGSRRPFGRWQTVGYFQTPGGEQFVATHNDGITAIGDAQLDGRFQMPEQMIQGYRMPLWSFLFEVHNGRIFRDWLGRSYYLISILGSLSLLAITFTGLYDWAYRKSTVRRAAEANRPSVPSTRREVREEEADEVDLYPTTP
jgi:hypothetical protein